MKGTALPQCTQTLIRMYLLLEHSLEVNHIEAWTTEPRLSRKQLVRDADIAELEMIGPTLGKSGSVGIHMTS